MATRSSNVLDIANASFCETLKCSICLDILTSPKALACLHTFCEECIQANINASGRNGRAKWIVCPECRQQTKPPGNCAPTEWAKQLPTNWPLMGFIERLVSHAAPDTVHETGDEVNGRMFINPNDLEECKKIELCPKHSKETLKFYCRDHSAIICKECKEVVHRQGCSIVEIDSIAQETTVAQNATNVHSQLDEIHKKLESTINAMKKDIQTVGETVENFQLRLHKLRNQVDVLMNEIQYELAGTEFRDQTKSRFTCSQISTIAECDSLQEAMRFSKSEMDVIEKYGTPVQRFIAIERLHSLIPMFKRAAVDNAKSATCMEIRHEGIEILDSIIHMQKEMKNIEGKGVKRAQ